MGAITAPSSEATMWVVLGIWEYEGSCILGIFATKAEAAKATCDANQYGHSYDRYMVSGPFEVGKLNQ
jgi:hypothetical protein